MTTNEIEDFERFLKDSFSDGIVFRELRLSYEEMQYLKKIYPKASLKKMNVGNNLDNKSWFQVKLPNVI